MINWYYNFGLEVLNSVKWWQSRTFSCIFPSDSSFSEENTVFLKHQLLRKSLTVSDVRQTNSFTRTQTHTHDCLCDQTIVFSSAVTLGKCCKLQCVFSVSSWAPAGTDGPVGWPLSDFIISIIIVLFTDSSDHPNIDPLPCWHGDLVQALSCRLLAYWQKLLVYLCINQSFWLYIYIKSWLSLHTTACS